MSTTKPQILITGAGPTGLVLALWLSAQNIPVRIIDKSPFTSTTSRAMVVHARVLELYQQLGLTEAILKAGHVAPATNLWYSGVHKARVPLKDIGTGKTPYPFVFILPQDRHERVLEERLKEFGVEVERGVELASFVDEGEKVDVTLRKDGKEEVCEVDYVAGCDGGRSSVRHALGVKFEGGTYPHAFFVADVEGSGQGFNFEVNINLSATDFMLVFGLDDMRHARLVGFISSERVKDLDSLTFDDVSHIAMNEMKVNVEKVNWFSTYHVHHRVADRFRQGRVFLVGDAAHVHSPVGGQGMNTGISDAINLAWKLAAVLKNRADDSLLDSYEVERRAFALTLVATTDQAFTAITSEGLIANTIRGWVVPYIAPIAMRIPLVTTRLFNTISQTMLNYRAGPLAEGSAGSVHAGDRLPWAVVNGVDNFSVLTIKWQVHVYGTATDDLVDWCKKKDIPLHVFEWDPEYQKTGLTRDAAYLLRPDTYIGAIDPTGSVETFEKFISSRGFPKLS
ncbi:FAD binding monooxygenase [Aspergillus sclerotialis]|uniref:FAD binding monooxygenase n=1 Tax=Aspergillus sclerotialis TaxID=2070753 RepID=A0A3A2ZMR1_9EURO|nr:FAD binding monooxygenase [Aspergillus sclerotialis]